MISKSRQFDMPEFSPMTHEMVEEMRQAYEDEQKAKKTQQEPKVTPGFIPLDSKPPF
jgi:hypothetical protein